MSEYAFCEPGWASTLSREHIREVPGDQLKIGGGITEPALCGSNLDGGWDIPVGVTTQRVTRGLRAERNPTCRKCADIWGRAVMGDEWELLTLPAPTDLAQPEQEGRTT